jgi:hypothetical protein
VSLESLGRPTVVVVTTDFVREAEVQRAALGMPGLHPVVIDHPLSTLTDAEIDRRADQAAAQCPGVWLGA